MQAEIAAGRDYCWKSGLLFCRWSAALIVSAGIGAAGAGESTGSCRNDLGRDRSGICSAWRGW